MSNIKKCLMVQQPYASRIVCGIKTIEVRSSKWGYKGDLLIGASKGDLHGAGKEMSPGVLYPRGVIVGLVRMVGCVPYTADMAEASGMEYEEAKHCEAAKMWAWQLEPISECKPLAVKGQVKPFDFDATGLELTDEDHVDLYNFMVNPAYVPPEFDDDDDDDDDDDAIFTPELADAIEAVRGEESFADWSRRVLTEAVEREIEKDA